MLRLLIRERPTAESDLEAGLSAIQLQGHLIAPDPTTAFDSYGCFFFFFFSFLSFFLGKTEFEKEKCADFCPRSVSNLQSTKSMRHAWPGRVSKKENRRKDKKRKIKKKDKKER